MSRIVISLIEDEAHTADMLIRLLTNANGFLMASHHATAEDAIARLPEVEPRPEIVLVDLKLPGMGGIECIAHVKRLLPGVLCLVITQFDDSDLLFAALQSGADGYLLKRVSDQEIIEGIRTVHEGGGAMSPSICRKVLDYFRGIEPSRRVQSSLSDREIELLQLARRGKRAKEIARAMDLSYQTVRTHFRNIYRKLHVHSLRAAVEKTFENAPRSHRSSRRT
jgi:DNA-binding NarL/FixJ family response regulator